MDRFGITFRNPLTERQYMSWMVERVMCKGDLEFLCVYFLLLCPFFVQFVANPEWRWYHAPLLALNMVHLACDILARWRMSAEELAHHRTKMVTSMRFSILFFGWLLDIRPNIPITNFLTTFIANLLLISTMMSVCLRLKIQHHIPFQLGTTLSLMFFSTKRRCLNLMETPDAASVVSLAQKLDNAAKRIMSTMYGRFGLLHGGQQLVCPCLHLMAWVHVYVTLILGSFILWKLEQWSRQAFINTLPEERREDEGTVIEQDSVLHIITHACLLVVAFGVTWEFNFVLVRAIEAWGL